MSVAGLFVIGVVAAFLAFIVWANVLRRQGSDRPQKASEASRPSDGSSSLDRMA